MSISGSVLGAVFFFPLFLAGIILLQIFLSRRENRLLGLILPALSFLLSLFSMLNIIVTESMTTWEIFSAFAATFLFSNIPTLILLVIYFVCREKWKRKKQLEKMNIQDLN